MTASDCPQTGVECVTATCTLGLCGAANVAAGTPTTIQAQGDCLKNECNGSGAIVASNDNADIKDDSNPCTIDACAAGVPTHMPTMAGATCGTGQVCNAAGNCVGCVTGASCPGQDDECKARTCTANVCGFAFTAAGTAVAAQTSADCKKNQCDGAGAIVGVADDADVPVDNLPCTNDVCTAGVPSNPPLAAGAACAQGTGTTCNGSGQCVQCVTASTCPGQDTECQARTCTAGACGLAFTAAGTVTPTQTAGDCKQTQCNGAGALVAVDLDADVPVDSQQCTGDVCTAGVPSNPPLAAGTACTQSGGTLCNGSGACTMAMTTTTDFSVLRVGDGVAALSSASTAGFIEHYLIDGTSAGATLNLPTVASGTNRPLTFAGTSTSEGGLSLSDNGHFLTLAGYAVAPGVAAISGTTSAVNNRVIGRVDASGVLDTSTFFLAAFSGSNIRSATSTDGLGFWASGGNSAVEYIPFGTSTATQLNTAPTNVRVVHAIGGQLYGTSGSGLFVNVFSVGTGTPTTTGQTVTSFPGMPTATASPYSFVLLDRNPLVPGMDTLYVADDRAVASGGGIQKWTSNGTTWALGPTFAQGTSGFRGLAGVVTGANVTLIATTAGASANAVVAFVDDGVTTPVGTVLATAPANTAYRGIAFTPK
jgi:hypothetical protein